MAASAAGGPVALQRGRRCGQFENQRASRHSMRLPMETTWLRGSDVYLVTVTVNMDLLSGLLPRMGARSWHTQQRRQAFTRQRCKALISNTLKDCRSGKARRRVPSEEQPALRHQANLRNTGSMKGSTKSYHDVGTVTCRGSLEDQPAKWFLGNQRYTALEEERAEGCHDSVKGPKVEFQSLRTANGLSHDGTTLVNPPTLLDACLAAVFFAFCTAGSSACAVAPGKRGGALVALPSPSGPPAAVYSVLSCCSAACLPLPSSLLCSALPSAVPLPCCVSVPRKRSGAHAVLARPCGPLAAGTLASLRLSAPCLSLPPLPLLALPSTSGTGCDPRGSLPVWSACCCHRWVGLLLCFLAALLCRALRPLLRSCSGCLSLCASLSLRPRCAVGHCGLPRGAAAWQHGGAGVNPLDPPWCLLEGTATPRLGDREAVRRRVVRFACLLLVCFLSCCSPPLSCFPPPSLPLLVADSGRRWCPLPGKAELSRLVAV